MSEQRLVLLFPSERHVEHVRALAPLQRDPVVLVAPAPRPETADEARGITWLTPEALVREAHARRDDRWLCCHEVGVYFAARHRDVAGRLDFGACCFDMLTKLEMQAQLERAGVLVAAKKPLEPGGAERLEYPAILKPNFGFASTLVKRVDCAADVGAYLARYAELSAASPLPAYQAAYFDDRPAGDGLDLVLAEPFIDGRFFSVPFVARSGTLGDVFPIAGLRAARDGVSDFHWRAFGAPSPDAPLAAMSDALERMIAAFDLRDGVFEAEMVQRHGDGAVFVLEFSPRLVGGSIPELVGRAWGVNLRRLSIAMFFGVEELFERVERACVAVCDDGAAAANGAPANGAVALDRFTRVVDGRRLVDTIYALPSEPAAVV